MILVKTWSRLFCIRLICRFGTVTKWNFIPSVHCQHNTDENDNSQEGLDTVAVSVSLVKRFQKNSLIIIIICLIGSRLQEFQTSYKSISNITVFVVTELPHSLVLTPVVLHNVSI